MTDKLTMKFKSYLNESALSVEKMLLFIDENCKPYIDDLKHLDYMLLSGRKSYSDTDIKTVRMDRRPLDTPKEIHDALDYWFMKKFGVRARSNSIFVTFDPYMAMDYGSTYFVFPIGEYKVISSDRVHDLLDEVGIICREAIGDMVFDVKRHFNRLIKSYKEKALALILRKMDDLGYKVGLSNEFGSEKMLICKKYAMIKYNYEIEVQKHFGLIK